MLKLEGCYNAINWAWSGGTFSKVSKAVCAAGGAIVGGATGNMASLYSLIYIPSFLESHGYDDFVQVTSALAICIFAMPLLTVTGAVIGAGAGVGSVLLAEGAAKKIGSSISKCIETRNANNKFCFFQNKNPEAQPLLSVIHQQLYTEKTEELRQVLSTSTV